MPPPAPPVPLKDQCSIIHDETLYVYSPEALQSLSLQKDATWSQQPKGVSVSGAACVLGNVDGDHTKPALYVVGGSTNSSVSDYPGLQRFLIGDKKWETITPVTRVTQNRQHHGAAALNASSSILVYGGSQDGDSNPSTQTFLMDMWPPYNVRSFNSLAPPVVDPLMLAWNTNRVAMIGGSPTNTQVFTFGPDDGWADAGVALKAAPPARTVAQSAVLSLVDESKILFTFDFSQSPNQVTRTVLLNPGGQPAPFGTTTGDIQSISRRQDITLNNFPGYNDSLAPSSSRNGASLAQGDDGIIIITGGNDQDPISIFNPQRNQWIDPTAVVGDRVQSPLSSSSPSSSPTASPSASSTPAPAGGATTPTRIILGAVLGSICGIAAVLVIALLLLKWRKQKRKAPNGEFSDFQGDKKRRQSRQSRQSYDDQGIPIRPAAQPMGKSRAPRTESMTFANGRGAHSRNVSSISSRFRLDPQRTSNVSFGPGMFSQKKSPLAISKPIPHEGPTDFQGRPSTSSSRTVPNHIPLDQIMSNRKDDSQGWSTYFAGNPASDMGQRRQTTDSRASQVSSGSRGSYWPDPSAPNSKLRATTSVLSDGNGNQLTPKNVHSRSPTIGHTGAGHGVAVREGIPAKISNTHSVASSLTSDYNEKNAGSAYPSSQPVADQWNFLASTSSGPSHRLNRPPSSTYTYTTQQPIAPSRTDDAPKASSARPVTQWPADNPTASNSRPGTSKGYALPSYPTRPLEESPREPRDFFGAHQHRGDPSNDMSWLNLNNGNNQGGRGPGAGSGTANH